MEPGTAPRPIGQIEMSDITAKKIHFSLFFKNQIKVLEQEKSACILE